MITLLECTFHERVRRDPVSYRAILVSSMSAEPVKLTVAARRALDRVGVGIHGPTHFPKP